MKKSPYLITVTVSEPKIVSWKCETFSWWARLWGKKPVITPITKSVETKKELVVELTEIELEFFSDHQDLITYLIANGGNVIGESTCRKLSDVEFIKLKVKDEEKPNESQ